MPAYETKLIGKEIVAEGTVAFRFEKPAGFQFEAGQSVDIKLLQEREAGTGNVNRTFSLVNAPQESELTVATRMRDSGFKRILNGLATGSVVKFSGPHGNMTLHSDLVMPAVFLAGGIGVTPFVSIIRQAARNKVSRPIYLFFSNRRLEDAPYLSELEQLQQANPEFRLIATMTAAASSAYPWHGETGYIDRPMLNRYLRNLALPKYYVAGPPPLEMAMRDLLDRAGVSGEQICGEEFYGY